MNDPVDARPQADEPPSPIDLTVETEVAPEQAWAALTEPRLIAEWFTDATSVGRIGDAYRLDFGDASVVEGVITELTIPTAGSFPGGITAGPDGNLWFCANGSNRIVRLTPAGVFTEFPIPNAFPSGGPSSMR